MMLVGFIAVIFILVLIVFFALFKSARARTPEVESEDEEIIREAIAHRLDKKPKKLTKEDYKEITQLVLSCKQISNIEPLKGLSNLQELHLNDTQVSNIEPLRGLVNLQKLGLYDTPVSNIEPLKGLVNLQWLDLSGTWVRNIEPLKGLSNLQELGLIDTWVGKKQVSELQKALPNLRIYRIRP